MNQATPAASAPAVLFPPPPGGSAAALSFGELAAILWRNVWLIVACIAFVTLLAFGLYTLQQPTFASTARVLVQTDQLGTPSFISGITAYRETQTAEPVSRKIETEMALLASRASATDVVQTLGLQRAQLPGSPIATAGALLAATSHKWTGWPAANPGDRARLVDDFLDNLSIEPVRSKTAETTSNVIELRFDSTDPAVAPRVLSELLAAYLRLSTQRNRELGSATLDLLHSQIGMAQNDLRNIEDSIVALAVRDSTRTDFVASEVGPTGGAAGRRTGSRAANESAGSQLVMQLLDLQSQLDEMRLTFTDETESVRKLKQRVADARNRLGAQMRASATSAATFDQLDRQRTIAQDRYVELRRKLDQIDLYMALTPAALDGRIVVDPPSQPDPQQSRKKKSLLFAGPIAGLLLGVFLAAMNQFFRPRLRSRRDVERAFGVPLLGAIPRARGRLPFDAAQRPDTP